MSAIPLTIQQAIEESASHALMSAYTHGFPSVANRFFRFINCSSMSVGDSLSPQSPFLGALPPPAIDWRLWNGEDDVLTFLNDQDETGAWYDSDSRSIFGGYAQRAARPGEAVDGTWICDVATWMLPYVSGRAYRAQIARRTVPVWPGSDNVILGDPVALAQELELADKALG